MTTPAIFIVGVLTIGVYYYIITVSAINEKNIRRFRVIYFVGVALPILLFPIALVLVYISPLLSGILLIIGCFAGVALILMAIYYLLN